MIKRICGLLFLLLLATAMLSSCKKDCERSLQLAEDNRAEVEKVLHYFKNDPDPLKYESALFLIENMAYHSFVMGDIVDSLESLYYATANEPLNLRDAYYRQHLGELDISGLHEVLDIQTIKADLLITMIHQACETWHKVNWNNQYDKSIFFDYVLPYRLNHEPLSNWYDAIETEFPLLNSSVILSRRGVQYEAENANIRTCVISETEGASNYKAVFMTNRHSRISINLHSDRDTKMRIILKYTGTARNLHLTINVNGTCEDTLNLVPTRNIHTFGEIWFNKPISIKKGENTISLNNASDTLGVDYIQFGAVENFTEDDVVDFSEKYYYILNRNSNQCITVDTIKEQVNLKPFNGMDRKQLICLSYQGYPLWRISPSNNNSTDNCLEIKFGTKGTLSPDSLVTMGHFEKRPFQQWIFFPLSNGYYRIMNKHSGMFLESHKDLKTGSELLVQNVYSINSSQEWELRRCAERTMETKTYGIGTSISEALRVFDITHQFQFFTYPGNFRCKGSTLMKVKAGKCIDEALYTVYLCRYLGIPSTIDFTPNWGNRSNGHSWSVLIKPDGHATPFYMGNVPGDTIHYFHPYKKPKIFRSRFQKNDTFVQDLKNEKGLPDLFHDLTFTDVTDEYCVTTDVEREVPKPYKTRRVAYICVFDNKTWVPVFYGKIKHGSVTFKSMGRGIMYMMALYEDGKTVPVGNPFYVGYDGIVRDVVESSDKSQTMTLYRKYPFMGEQDYFNSRMSGGQFQGSNNADFAQTTLLHIHQGITNGNWYDVSVENEKKFRFLRYIGPKGSFCNINELEFFDNHGRKISGNVIGTEGEAWGKKENVFDGNILTGFGALSPDGNWVGLELPIATKVSRIRYIPRNDGNCIESGDEYVLYHWGNGDWQELESQVAKGNDLIFNNVPSGGLYVLSDITKGSEERIFTYSNGKQVWW